VTSTGVLTGEERHGAALAALGSSPATLRRFLDGYTPVAAWEAIAAGRHRADPDRRYRHKATSDTLDAVAALCARTDIAVRVLGCPGYPGALAADHQAPAVLFVRGDVDVLEGRPRVALVGTRAATPYGLGVAAELGRDLASAGVVVVSGLARGIDAAAHAGVLGAEAGAPPVGVVGTSLDTPAQGARATLHAAVAARGALLSEVPPGGPSARWWFAVRNRVMAALAHVVVVVECHHRGGSLHTVDAAEQRGVTVAAVPGSVRSPASAGSNRLIADGAVLVRDAQDVLTAIELAIASDSGIAPPGRRGAHGRRVAGAAARPALSAVARRVRRAIDHDPATLESIVKRCGLAIGEVSLALEQLAEAGLAVGVLGWWSRPR